MYPYRIIYTEKWLENVISLRGSTCTGVQKRLLERKRTSSKYKCSQQRRRWHILSFISDTYFSSRVPVVLHEHLTQGSSVGSGGVIGEANQMPSLWVSGYACSSFCPFTHKPVRIPYCHLLREKGPLGVSCQSLLAVKSTTQTTYNIFHCKNSIGPQRS